MQIYPSLLAAPESQLDHLIRQLEPLCPGFHIDIMDNEFVPNTGMSIERANLISKITYRQLWVHLMVEDPESYFDKLQIPADSMVTFHIESHKKTPKTIQKITQKKWLPGIALNPNTGVDEIFPFIDSLHQVLIMSVKPGFSGQPFLEDTLSKIDPLLGYRDTRHLNFKIAMDGGITIKNFKTVAEKGIDQVAIGSAIFEAKAGAAKAYELFSELAD